MYDDDEESETKAIDTNHISHLILYQLNCCFALKLIGNWRRAKMKSYLFFAF